MRKPLPFWTKSGEGRGQSIAAERLVNWFLEPNQGNPNFPFSLLPAPGLIIRAVVGTGPVRGVHKMGDAIYVVSGSKIYSVAVDWLVTELGDINGTGLVSMANNGTHVLVVTEGQNSYAANQSGVFAIPEQDLVSAAYQDGYGIAGKRGSEQFYHSDLDDMTGWTATAFSSADALADKLVAVASMKRRLWCFGEDTIEIWYNYGGSPFAFQREQGGFMEVGCVAPNSVSVLDETIAWLGKDGTVYVSNGGPPKPITDHGISRIISKQPSQSTAFGFLYKQEDHLFYVLTLSSVTLACDLKTGLWAHRASLGLDRWRGQAHAYAWGKHVVGDYSNGRLYEMVLDEYVEPDTSSGTITAYANAGAGKVTVTSADHGLVDGQRVYLGDSTNYDGNYTVSGCTTDTFDIVHAWDGDDAAGTWVKYVGCRRLGRNVPMYAGGHRVAHDELMLEIESGVGLDGDQQGNDPVLMMRYSNDGETWSNERTGKMGKMGEYGKQVRWHRLGQFKKRIVEISCSDPVKAVIHGAYADTEVLGK